MTPDPKLVERATSDPSAQIMLGELYEKHWGDQIHHDWREAMEFFKEAIRWYCKAASEGNIHAMYLLAQCCSKFKEPADENFSFFNLCEDSLATMKIKLDRSWQAQLQTIAYLYEVAAGKGSVEAMVAFGDLLVNGEKPNKMTLIRAAKWYAKAGENGNAVALKKVVDLLEMMELYTNWDLEDRFCCDQ